MQMCGKLGHPSYTKHTIQAKALLGTSEESPRFAAKHSDALEE
jgi:hypothetical protein